SERALLFVCLAVVAAACYDLFIQYAAVPSCMRYIPPESTAYVVTSPLRTLWTGARPHLERFFKDKPSFQSASEAEETFATGLARNIKENLKKKNIALWSPHDLPELGINPELGAAVAIVDGGSHWLLAVPLVDAEKFKETLVRYQDSPF